jgi:acetyltransferase-like isoleucine patch superfamily enzyme
VSGLRERLPERLRWLPRDIGYLRVPRIASALRKWWVLARHPHAQIVFGEDTYLGPGFSLHVPAEGTFICGPGCEFRRGFRCELAPGAKVEIGVGSRFTYDVLIQCGTTIQIGDRVMFGQSSAVFDGNHRFRDPTRPMLDQGYDFRPITVADDATVTTKCTVVADIGEHAFIGANSVVSRPIPAYTLAVGAPARPIEYYGPPGSEPEELTAARSSR